MALPEHAIHAGTPAGPGAAAMPEALEDGDPPGARFELRYTSGPRDRPPTRTSPRIPTPSSATVACSGTATR
jgi:hypothetical protein